MKLKQLAWMLCSVLMILFIMMGTLGAGATASTLSEGETSFLCLSNGNPGVPGDGIIVNSTASIPFFDVQPLFPIAGITDGITISFFTPVTPVSQIAAYFTTIAQPHMGCDIGYGSNLLRIPNINGVQGFAQNLSRQNLLDVLGELSQQHSFCADLTLDDYAFDSIIIYSGIAPDFQPIYIRELDALAIGIGENVFPTARTPVQCVEIDRTPPIITILATPEALWPPNGKLVPVTLSGTITDSGGSEVNASSAAYVVMDEYGQVQPKGSVTLESNGSYAFTISLQASRNGNDQDGRHYTIAVSAKDNAGNLGVASTIVTVPHDQG